VRGRVGSPVEPLRFEQGLEGDGEGGDTAVRVGQEHQREQVGLVAELVPFEVERLVVAMGQAEGDVLDEWYPVG
jgi:hypothetical protein